MKKTLLTIAIVLGMTLGAVAQKQGGGLFGMGAQRQNDNLEISGSTRGDGLLLPTTHGDTNDNPAVPLGGGALLLIGFGAAYALRKKNNK